MNKDPTPNPSGTETPNRQEHISDVRALLIEQLRVLKAAPVEKVAEEIKRARSMSELAQVIVNSAKVEVDYIEAVKGASESTFLQERETERVPQFPTAPQSPLPAPSDPARLGGPSPDHVWRGGFTRHRLGR